MQIVMRASEVPPDLARFFESLPSGDLHDVFKIATEPCPEAHFATFPKALVTPCVKAGTSERGCCATCGAPWVRVIKRQKANPPVSSEERRAQTADETGRSDGRSDGPDGIVDVVQTAGWRRTCKHGGEPVPCTVLDPFAGSGTTLLVANTYGRNAIGTELNPEYAEIARRRLGGNVPLFAREA